MCDCTYPIARLQCTYSLLTFPPLFSSPAESDLDYDSRRMSSSATSTADTDSSLSRGEKRALTPSESPQPKKPRNAQEQNNWDIDQPAHGSDEKASSEGHIDHSKVQLPSIFTSFEDTSYQRRASLPVLNSDRIRHSPYPPTSLRQTYGPGTHSALSSYTFPNNDDSAVEKNNGRPRLTTDFMTVNSYDSPYPNSGLSNGTTPSSSAISSSAFNSPMSDYHRPPGLSPYPENDHWNTSPSAIVRPSSTPGLLSSPPVKYEDGFRHASFSTPMSQAQMFAGSARISGQQDRSRSLSGIKSEWSFPNQDFVLPPNAPYSPSMPSTAPPITVSGSPSRSPQSVPSSTLVDRPQRKRGKLPKETTDFLKSWLHRHSDHPYPSEEEKKQLCNATGLSMSQVSNWMINVSTELPHGPNYFSNSFISRLDVASSRLPIGRLRDLRPLLPSHLQAAVPRCQCCWILWADARLCLQIRCSSTIQ